MQKFIEAVTTRLNSSSIISRKNTDLYKIDDLTPEIVISPDSEEQVCAILQEAHNNGGCVCPWGGGTRMDFGYAPGSYTAALNLNGLNSIKEYEPADLTVITEAGMTIEKLNASLADHGQFIPLNPPHPDRATVGGTLVSNGYGFHREYYGSARDMTLGIRFVRADGSPVKGGGKVAKNVAGYDLTKLMIGSWGTLGVITEAAFRVKPLPEDTKTISAGFKSLSAARLAAFSILDSYFAPTFLAILNAKAAGRMFLLAAQLSSECEFMFLVGVDGIEATANWQEQKIKESCTKSPSIHFESLDEKIANNTRTALRDHFSNTYPGIIVKIISSRTGTFELIEIAEQIGTENGTQFEIASFPGSGITHIGMHENDMQDNEQGCLKALQSLGDYTDQGRCVFILERAPLHVRSNFPVWDGLPGAKLMKKIKKQFDPNNILNPERYISLLD